MHPLLIETKWKKRNKSNQWLDALYNACAAAHYGGMRLVDEPIRPKQRLSLGEMARRARWKTAPTARELAEKVQAWRISTRVKEEPMLGRGLQRVRRTLLQLATASAKEPKPRQRVSLQQYYERANVPSARQPAEIAKRPTARELAEETKRRGV
jgi:hypothetical protein